MDIRDEIKELERRFAEAPDSRLFLPLADALFRAGEISRARDLCEQGLESYPDFVGARVLLVKCYNKLGDTEKAKEIADETSLLDSENEQLSEIAAGDAGDPLAIEDNIKRPDHTVAKADSELADIFITQTLADIYRIQGYDKRALKIYHRLHAKNPADEKLKELIKYLEVNGVSGSELESGAQAADEPETGDVSVVDDMIEAVIADGSAAAGESDGGEEAFSDNVLLERVNNIFNVVLGESAESFSNVSAQAESRDNKSEDNREYLQMVERWIGELAG